MIIRQLSAVEATIPIPETKAQAILALFDQVLLTQGDEAQRIIKQIRGRRQGPLTFGELRAMADDVKIARQATAAGVENLGEAPTDLARVLQHITPDLAICEVCGKYPIAEIGGVVSLLTEGRCPHCNQGLITAPKQAEPYQAWTTLEMVSPSQTHDRRSITHLSLPLRNDAIIEESGRGIYTIDPLVRQAIEQEGLVTVEGQINVAHFLTFLAHSGHFTSRFCGLDEVLIALGRPESFGAYDLVSIRAVVRQAKSWAPRTSVVSAVTPAHPVNSAKPITRLDDLLQELFTLDELKVFVSRFFDRGFNINLEWSSSVATSCNNVARAINRNGYDLGNARTELLNELVRVRPGREAMIRACFQVMR